jgi:hypothetical protein
MFNRPGQKPPVPVVKPGNKPPAPKGNFIETQRAQAQVLRKKKAPPKMPSEGEY